MPSSAVAEGTPFPEGPPKSSVGGGFLAGTCHPAHVLASSRGSLSVLRDFRPGLSIPHFQRVRSDQAPWPQLSSRSAGVHRHACVACMGPACLTSYSHVVHREPGSGGRAPVCPKVVRACSQPQGMILHFETWRSGVVKVLVKPHGKKSLGRSFRFPPGSPTVWSPGPVLCIW